MIWFGREERSILNQRINMSSVRLLRVETQSDPKSDDGGDAACGVEVDCKLVVTSCDAAPILEAAEHALDEVASLIGLWVEGLEVLSGGIVGNDGLRAAFDQKLPESVAVVGRISGAEPGGRE